jgi:hypothetical protein
MTELINRLPVELANMIYSYVGMHPVAQLIEDKLIADKEKTICKECYCFGAEEDYDGMCEYCYAEELGVIVYRCEDCSEKCFEYGRFENTDDGLFCEACYMGYLEMQEEEINE